MDWFSPAQAIVAWAFRTAFEAVLWLQDGSSGICLAGPHHDPRFHDRPRCVNGKRDAGKSSLSFFFVLYDAVCNLLSNTCSIGGVGTPINALEIEELIYDFVGGEGVEKFHDAPRQLQI